MIPFRIAPAMFQLHSYMEENEKYEVQFIIMFIITDRVSNEWVSECLRQQHEWWILRMFTRS